MSPKPLILVADDDPLLRTLMEFKLVQRGYQVLTACDGDAATQLLAATRPDLVVLDAMMPGPDGYEILRRLKADPALRPIPVLMLTARKLESDIVGALQMGASDYVVKPFIPEELAMRIGRLLAQEGKAAVA